MIQAASSCGRIGEPEAQGLRARALNPLVAGLLFQPMVELIEEDALLGGRVLHHVRITAHGEQIDMDADELVGMGAAHPRGGDRAPVAALHREALVAERVAHQVGENVRHLLDAEALLPGLKRQAVARQRRRDDREGVARIGAEARRIGEARNEVDELEHRSRPAVHQQQRRGIGSLPRDMQKVQIAVRARQPELREGVEARLLRAPVEGSAPGVDQAAQIVDIRPVAPRLARRAIRKPGARQALAQVRKVAVGNAQCERLRHRLLLDPRFSNGGRLEVKRTLGPRLLPAGPD